MNTLEAIPKVDLHYHLDGGIRPATIMDIAIEEGIELPKSNITELVPYLEVEENCSSLSDYLQKFSLPISCLQSGKSQKRVAYEAVEDAAKQNIKYIEVRFAPLLLMEQGLTMDEVVLNVLSGLKQGEKDFGTTARAILVCIRNQPADKNMEVIESASRFLGNGVVGVDLAGDEAKFPPILHREVFKLAQKLNIPITIHAGEAGGANNIFDAIAGLGAVRIGHGIRLKEDQRILDYVKSKRVALEICLSSNLHTKAASSWRTHPVREYFENGILITVNTDNTTVSNTNITKELSILSQRYHFTMCEIRHIMINSLEVSFLDEYKKRELIQDFTRTFEIIDSQSK